MINLGKLKEIKDLRKVWPHEALDFTPWLAEEDNLTLLADAVGLAITVDETESGVGDFKEFSRQLDTRYAKEYRGQIRLALQHFSNDSEQGILNKINKLAVASLEKEEAAFHEE